MEKRGRRRRRKEKETTKTETEDSKMILVILYDLAVSHVEYKTTPGVRSMQKWSKNDNICLCSAGKIGSIPKWRHGSRDLQ